MDEMRGVLRELNAGVLRQDRTAEELFDRAYRMRRMRRVIARTGSGYLVLPRGRPLVSYYANSVAHLLGSFAESVRARDALPAMAGLAPLAVEERTTLGWRIGLSNLASRAPLVIVTARRRGGSSRLMSSCRYACAVATPSPATYAPVPQPATTTSRARAARGATAR